MHRIGSILLLAACLGGLGHGVAAGAPLFQIRAVDLPYRNVGTEAFYEQFNLDIDTPVINDELFVEMTPHLPDGWLSQFCVTSNGSCFLYSHAITIPSNGHERLQIDFVLPLSHEPGMGRIDIRIYRVNDPTTWQEVDYALGYGVELPVSRFSFTSGNVFQQADPNATVPFTSTIRSLNNFDDHLIVTMYSDMPDGWFAQFCQVSTGVCYFGNAVIPFPAFATDELQVDFFCFNPDPAIGNLRLKLQSEANPAMWTALAFRVRTGDIPAGVDSPGFTGGLSATVAPNPVRGKAELHLVLAQPAPVEVRVVDIAGRTVLERTVTGLGVGDHVIGWDAKDALGEMLPSGTYFYRATGAGQQVNGKFTIHR